jgi:DNA-nicking Smr family endonuclease
VSVRRPASRRKPVKKKRAPRRRTAKPATRRRAALAPRRWNANPEDAQRSVVKLVLSLVEFIRQLMERQAIRRLEAGTLTPDEIERLGQALMKLEETVQQIAKQFDLDPDDLNLDLGPLGSLR